MTCLKNREVFPNPINKQNKLTDEDASSPAANINRELSSGHVNKCDRVKFCARLPP